MKKLIVIAFLLAAGVHGVFAQQGGDLDSTFGINGKASIRIEAGDDGDNLEDMLLQPDGRIVCAGWYFTGISNNTSDLAMTRHFADGTIDSSFGVNGIAAVNLSQNYDQRDFIRKAALQPDGKILVTGGIDAAAAIVAVIARFLPNGNIDSTFGTNGIVTNDFGQINNVESHTILVQPDKKIVIGTDIGYIARYDSSGVIDSTFGVNGVVYIDQSVEKGALQDDGKIVVAGGYYSGGSFFGVRRFHSNGDPDSTFGTNGLSYFDFNDLMPGSDADWVNDVRILPGHKIIVGGGCTKYDFIDGYDTTMFAVVKLKADGSPDSSFGTNGKTVVQFGGDFERIHNITLQADSSICLVGEANSDYFAVARLNSDGMPDSTFSEDGKLLLDFGSSPDYAYASVLQPDGKLLVSGPANDGNNYAFGIARILGDLAVGTLNLSKGSMQALIYPNPIRSQETLEYSLINEETISICLFDVQGRLVKTFINNELQQKGMHRQALSFPGNLAQGTYFISISSVNARVTLKVVK